MKWTTDFAFVASNLIKSLEKIRKFKKNKKMNKSKLLLAFMALSVVFFVSCETEEKTPVPTPGTPGTVKLGMTNVAGNVNLDGTGATSYINSSGESFTVSAFKFYVSNVRLYNGGTLVYTMPESYFLVDEAAQASTQLHLLDVPAGSYTSVRFNIGIDSARNVSGAQTGALDPAHNMFWTWSTGYIFFKIEGKSPASPQADSSFIYHIGGFQNGNNTNAIREVNINLGGESLVVNGTRNAEIHLLVDVLKLFSTPSNISIANLSLHTTPGGNALMIANNYVNMFEYAHIHN